MTLIFITLFAAYVVACLYAYLVADKLLFPDIPSSYESAPDIVSLDSKDGEQISTLYLPAEGSEQLLLYSYGNGEDIGKVRPLLEAFRRAGIAVLAYDYPGYGTSSGETSEAGVYAASEAAFTYATSQLEYRPGQIFLYGRSLGGGPSCWLAEQYPVGGVILEGAFSSAFRVMTRVRLLPWDKFDNLKRMPSIESPVLIVHGVLDRTVPLALAKQNWKAASNPHPPLWVQDAGHNDLIEKAGQKYWETVLPFIQSRPKPMP